MRLSLLKPAQKWAFLLFIIALSPLPAMAQQSALKTIHVKFHEDYKPVLPLRGRVSRMGIEKVDRINEKHKAVSIKRIFPDGGTYESAHKAFGLHLWYEIKVPRDANIRSVINDFRETDYFENVEESRPYVNIGATDNSSPIATLPNGANDPYFSSQWHYKNTGQAGGKPGADINLLKAWQIETGSPNVIVAVIDGGINIDHVDLKDALWTNGDEIPGNGLDDDHNGYVDDLHGYGFGDQSPIIYANDHGTHVAGTIGAVSNNGTGVSGIAGGNGFSPGVRLMSCAGFGKFDIGGFEEAMVYAADNGAVISQNSWGGGSTAIEAAIDYFIARAGYDNTSANFNKNIQTGPMAGGVVIFAAGNANTNNTDYGYPASYDKVIAVASTDPADMKSSFSNYGWWVEISAPGSFVFSTKGSSYGYFSGTSMACPHVSGVAALIVSNIQRTGLKPSEIWNRLRFSARSIDEENPLYVGQLGWGRLNAHIALREADAIPPGAILDLHGDDIHSSSLRLKWTASGEDNAVGQAAEYEIRYSINPIDESNFNAATLITHAPIPPPAGEQVELEVKNLLPFTTYYFALKSIDVFSNVSTLSNVLSVRTLRLPTPDYVTTQLSESLFTGRILTKEILVSNLGEAEDLLIRAGVPQLQPAPVKPHVGATGRLFAIERTQNVIQELNTKNGQIIRSIPMPEPSSKIMEGLAFDGKYLYYGKTGKVYKIDAESGAVVRTIYVNKAIKVTGLAWSGRYLYVSSYGTYYDNGVFEVDVDSGTIVRTLDNRNGELTFLGKNSTLLTISNGQLNEINLQNNNVIRQIPGIINAKCTAYSSIDDLIFVSDDYTATIKAIRPSDGTTIYTLQYPVTTALAGDEHSLGWLETTEDIIKIPAGQTIGVPVTFNATGLNTGAWSGSVNVIPINSGTEPFSIPLTLVVTAAADIETVKTLDFGNQYVGFPIDTTVIIENRGFTNLVVSQLQSSESKITTSFAPATLAPGEKMNVTVTVQSTEVVVIDATIEITSNDLDEAVLTIPVRTKIWEAPGILVTPDSLKATLATGESTTLNLTITNTGQGLLNWNAQLAGTYSQSLSQSETQVGVESKNALEEISLRASSPEAVTCLAYDPTTEVIYARGSSSTNFYTYNPVVDKWVKIGVTPAVTFSGQSAHLNGKLYYGGSQLNIYNIKSNSWTSVAFPTSGTAVSLTTDDKDIYIAIGKIFYRFNSLAGSWVKLAAVPAPIYMGGFAGLSYHSGVIFANGDQFIDGDGNTLFFKYYIASNTWTQYESINGKTGYGSAIEPSSGKYFVVGAPSALRDNRIQMSILDIREGEWTKLVMPFATGAESSLTFVNKQGVSGVYFATGDNGTKFGYYETVASTNWFSVTPPSGLLLPGDTQNISVNLNAQNLFGGVYKNAVVVRSEQPAIDVNVPLTLTVIGKPAIALNKLSANVGEIEIGRGRNVLVTIKNNGSGLLSLDSIKADLPDFNISSPPFTLETGQSRLLSFDFIPTSVGTQMATFTLYSNDPINGMIQFKMTGTGVIAGEVISEPDSIVIDLFSGEIIQRDITVRNIGGATTYFELYGFPDEWLKGHLFEPIAAGEEKIIPFKLDASGKSTGTFLAEIMDNFSTKRIKVKMNVTSAPSLYTSADSIDFGQRFVDGSYEREIQIKNNGVLPLTVSSVHSSDPAFSISFITPQTLAADESVNVVVRFNTTVLGSHVSEITFASNDPNTVNVLKVKGISVDPPVLDVSNANLSFTVYKGESQSRTFALDNNGGSKLTWRMLEQSSTQQMVAGGFSSVANVPLNSGRPAKITGLTFDPTTGLFYSQHLYYQDIYSYNPSTNEWADVGSTLPITQYKTAGSVILNSKMFCTYIEDNSKLYIYDMILKSWTTVTNQLGVGTSTITTDGTLLYLAGSGKFVSYNPKSKQWAELSIPNFTLDGVGGLNYLDGAIYAHSANSNGFGKYTIATGVWENLLPLPNATVNGGTIDPIRKRYYAFGKSYLYEYDIKSSVWTVFYFTLFENGENACISFSSKAGAEGVFFTQGDNGKGFGRYEPKNELGWLRSSELIGEIEASDSNTIGINCNSTNLMPGEYHGKLSLLTNDPLRSSLEIPVIFEVKDPAPTIKVAELLTDSINRLAPTIAYLIIENDGRNTLIWSLENAIPSWATVNKTSGSISGDSKDSVEVTLLPNMLPSVGLGDYTFKINSNDPKTAQASTRLFINLQNSKPVVSTVLPPLTLDNESTVIALQDYFTDPDNDAINYTITSSVNGILITSLTESTLTITPVESGIVTITVKAKDTYNASVTTSFQVNTVITGTDSEITKSGWAVNPNPFTSIFKIKPDGLISGSGSLIVYDLSGHVVLRKNSVDVTAEELEIDGSSLASGLYLCVLFIDNKLIESIRIMKE